MKNRDVYLKDPGELRLLNNGVAAVSDQRTEKEKETLRYELETFVCEGGFEDGLERILGSFLRNLDSPEQEGVWVSGFYGSGKSHLVKVLRALWVDEVFPEDNASARGITRLPTSISDDLRDLSMRAKTHGGLHAASGTLGAGAGDRVRLALTAIVFRSAGLPTDYSQARFVMWLKSEGCFSEVKEAVEASGKEWEEELNNLLVATSIPQAILEVIPDFASDAKEARGLIRDQFPPVPDITADEMVDAIREAVENEDGEFPLTLIVLDEVQQYIGEDPDRSYAVQEMVETCRKRFEGRLLFVATGQSAIAGTPLLGRLKGRFTVPVQLSDSDVETVIRQIVLAKKPDAKSHLKKLLDENAGEISKHLVASKIGYRPEDQNTLVADYPLLPVRRRFWERCLRAVDPSGTKAQLRNQLRVVHEAAKDTADWNVGCTVPGDYIYHQIAPDMLNTGELPKETFEKIQALKQTDEPLKPRVAALCFLIGKLPREEGGDLGVRATEQTLTDLLVSDLQAGSGQIQKELPAILESLVDSGLLMPVEDEYLIQTQEGSAWLAEFMAQKTQIESDAHQVTQERDQLFRREWREHLKKIRYLQGESKVPRNPELCFGEELSADADQQIYVWARDGWDTDESAVKSEALQAGSQSPTLCAFLPRNRADELKSAIIESRAAEATLNARGTPGTPEGAEAQAAMLTRKEKAEQRIRDAIDKIFRGAQVYSGGGQPIDGIDAASKVEHGLQASLARLYPKFDVADYGNWSKVINQARGGSPNPLEAIGHKGNVDDHEVSAEMLKFVGPGKKGSEIRDHFGGSPYGWPRDAIDGGIFALAATGHLRVQLDGQVTDVSDLTQGQVTKHTYRVETKVPSADDKIRVKKLLQELALPYTAGKELAAVSQIPPALLKLADEAGGEPPRPVKPDTKQLQELASFHGNELLIELADQQESLLKQAKTWKEQASKVSRRIVVWERLQRLLNHAHDLPEIGAQREEEAATIRESRQLLDDPDPVDSLYQRTVQALREALADAVSQYRENFEAEQDALEQNASWQALDAGQQETLLKSHGLANTPDVKTATDDDVIAVLEATPLRSWADRIGALGSRFAELRLTAAKLLKPKARPISLPRRTLETREEVDEWLSDVEAQVKAAIEDGPVVV